MKEPKIMKPKRIYKIKLKIISVKKAQPMKYD